MNKYWLGLAALLCLCARALALDLGAIRPGEVALWVADVDSGKVLAEHRAQQPLQPASTMKLITGWAALEQLGPDYRWRSEMRSAAPLEGGVLRGDLYWVGRGDPRFYLPDLYEMLAELRRRGVEKLEGRVLLDKSAFNGVGSADGFERDADRAFTVAPDTHLTHLKVAWLHYYHDGAGARVALEPALPQLALTSRLEDGGDAACGDVRRHVKVTQTAGRIVVEGRLPRACDGAVSYVNVEEHDGYAEGSFTALWRELGGAGPQAFGAAPLPAGTRLLAQHDSLPLSTILADVNKFSNNTMTRQIFLTLGATSAPGTDTRAAAAAAVRAQLRAHGLDDGTLQLENGSGLSRSERVSAELLGRVLLAAARGPWSGELLASLPVAGRDGTLKKRLGGCGPGLRLKTGTLDDVSAVAGYWQGGGRRLALVAIVNSTRAPQLTPALDQLVARVVADYGG